MCLMNTSRDAPGVPLEANPSDRDADSGPCATPIVVSEWLHERVPPLHELLCTHDLVRLTRRLRCVIAASCLIRRITKAVNLRDRLKRSRPWDAASWLSRQVGGRRDATRRRFGPRRRRRKPGPRGRSTFGFRR